MIKSDNIVFISMNNASTSLYAMQHTGMLQIGNSC